MIRAMTHILFIMIALLAGSVSLADINGDLKNYYDELGVSSNVTSPAVYHAQEAGYYTGGSINMRSRVRDVQLVQATMPSFRSGCANVNVLGGSVSVISTQEIKDALNSILSAGGSYAFTLALETATPELANVMKYWNDFANKINQSSINSCEMAESLVGGMWPKVRGAHERICEDIGTSNNVFSSWAEAQQKCGHDGQSDSVIDQYKNDPKYKDLLFTQGNVVWKAIQKRSLFNSDPQLAELFISFSGTVVFYKDAEGTHQDTWPALIENNDLVTALFNGGHAVFYQCDDRKDCLTHTTQTIDIKEENSFKGHTAKLLRDIVTRIIDDKEITSDEKELLGLLNSTNLPIYKTLTVEAAYLKDRSLPDMDQFADVIASEILYQYLHESLQIIKESVASLPYPDAVLEKIEPNIEKQIQALSKRHETAYKQLSVIVQMIEQTQTIERMMAGDLSNQFGSTLSWAKGLR